MGLGPEVPPGTPRGANCCWGGIGDLGPIDCCGLTCPLWVCGFSIEWGPLFTEFAGWYAVADWLGLSDWKPLVLLGLTNWELLGLLLDGNGGRNWKFGRLSDRVTGGRLAKAAAGCAE